MLFSTRPVLAALLLTGSAFVEAKPCKSRHPQSESTAVTSSAAAVSTDALIAETSASSTLIAVATTSSAAVASSSTTAVATVAAVASSSSSAAASTSTATASSGLTTDETNALDTQNSARSDVSETALTWSSSLAADAQTWAEHLADTYGSSGELVHSSDTGEGENLYWQSDSSTPYANAATAWVDEKSLYSGEAISDDAAFETYGHYSKFLF